MLIHSVTSSSKTLYICGILYLLLTAVCSIFHHYEVFLIPPVLVILYLAAFSHDKLLMLIVALTPLSVNMEELGSEIGLYLPTEPLLFGFMLLRIFKIFSGGFKQPKSFMMHPLTLIIFTHILWLVITSITSTDILVSLKFLTSRLWYLIPVYFFGTLCFKEKKWMILFFWCYAIPMGIVILYTLIHHAANSFGEEEGHWVMAPFFKDHTSYGAMIAFVLPGLLLMLPSYRETKMLRSGIWILIVVYIIGLIFSYTRAAWVSLAVALGVLAIIQLRIKLKYLLLIAGLVLGKLYLEKDQIKIALERNNSEHATEDFAERIESVSNISTDASNLERINRWTCALDMFNERPIFGFGPGTYQFEYAPFQLSKNKTIISTSFGDGGNAHSEFLGPLAETGLIGMLIMIALVGVALWKSIALYLVCEDHLMKRLLLFVILGLTSYFTHGLLNNYLDTDKASVPIWGAIAMIVAIELYHHKNGSLKDATTE